MRFLPVLALGLAALLLGVLPPPGGGQTREVVVSSARSHYNQEPAFDAFTRRTGIQIRTLGGNASELFERLRAEGDPTPAGGRLTAHPAPPATTASPELVANTPAHRRDPEQRWFGLTTRARTIMYNVQKVKPAELSTYEALGDPKRKGRVCLRPASHVYNQSLIATMIKRDGEARVEGLLRGWVANRPTLIGSDTKILEAIAAGQCDVGVTNTYYLGRLLAKNPALPVAPFWANQQTSGTHVNVSGAGVTASARHRAEAAKLPEVLSSPEG